MADDVSKGVGAGTPAADDTVTAGAGGEKIKTPEAAEPDKAPEGKEPAEVKTPLGGVSKEPKDGEGPEGGKEPDAEKKTPEGAPEKYERFKLPEGMEYDEQAAEMFGSFAKEQGLSQEGAQKAVDFYCSLVSKRIAKEREDFTRWCDGQEKSMKDDAEFGGARYEENLATARLGLEKLAPPELLEYVNHNWLGSFKPFVMMCFEAGKLVKEGALPPTGSGVGGAMSEAELAKKMFASEKKK